MGEGVDPPEEYAAMLKVVGETFRDEGLQGTLIYGPEHTAPNT